MYFTSFCKFVDPLNAYCRGGGVNPQNQTQHIGQRPQCYSRFMKLFLAIEFSYMGWLIEG